MTTKISMRKTRVLRVLLVDDHDIVRVGLTTLINGADDLEVVGGASTAAECLIRIATHRPDVVVLDVRLPDRNGIEVCRDIRSRFPNVKVLMLTAFADEEALSESLVAGASGFVLKQTRADELIAAVRAVGAGGTFHDSETTRRLTEGTLGREQSDLIMSKLSHQEDTVAHHLAEGLTNKEIAEEMGLAEKTVKNYVSNLLSKMGMSRRSQAAAYVAFVETNAEHAVQTESWDELPTPDR